jgi:hypothetical protein
MSQLGVTDHLHASRGDGDALVTSRDHRSPCPAERLDIGSSPPKRAWPVPW